MGGGGGDGDMGSTRRQRAETADKSHQELTELAYQLAERLDRRLGGVAGQSRCQRLRRLRHGGAA